MLNHPTLETSGFFRRLLRALWRWHLGVLSSIASERLVQMPFALLEAPLWGKCSWNRPADLCWRPLRKLIIFLLLDVLILGEASLRDFLWSIIGSSLGSVLAQSGLQYWLSLGSSIGSVWVHYWLSLGSVLAGTLKCHSFMRNFS